MELDLKNLNGMVINETFSNGQIKSCLFKAFNKIESPYGPLVPQFTENFSQYNRKKKPRPAIIFHENGGVKSLALEEQINIKSPIGDMGAELITFYKEGMLNRIFPLNGQIDGYWNEDDEGQLAQTHTFDLKIGRVQVKLVSLRLSKKGKLKSLTFWPKEEAKIQTPLGEISCKNGFSLYDEGQLKTMEPSKPVNIPTPIGKVLAYDPNAIGIHADSASLLFSKDGRLISVTSHLNTFTVTDQKGHSILIEPTEIESYVGDEDTELIPVKISFTKDEVTFYNGNVYTYKLDEIDVQIGLATCSVGGCANCNGCG